MKHVDANLAVCRYPHGGPHYANSEVFYLSAEGKSFRVSLHVDGAYSFQSSGCAEVLSSLGQWTKIISAQPSDVHDLNGCDTDEILAFAEKLVHRAGDIVSPRLEAKEMLEPGIYSVFLLRDDCTWTQPSYRISEPMTEREFRELALAEHHHDYFAAACVGADDDCPEEYVEELKKKD